MRTPSTLCLLALSLALIAGLSACDTNEPEEEINEDIVLVKSTNGDSRSPTYFMAFWRGNIIFATSPVREFTVGSNLEPNSMTEIYWDEIRGELPNAYGFGSYLTANQTGTELLIVKSNYGTASAGALYAYDLDINKLTLLRDSTYSVSSAVYLPGSGGSKLIYYSYGRPQGAAGYYLFDTTTGADSLLLRHRSPRGLNDEQVNGFDLHPDGQTLLIPDVGKGAPGAERPRLVEYDLQTKNADTLALEAPLPYSPGLWLRYSPDGRQILYSNFPYGAYTRTAHAPSEVGVIDRATGAKRILDVNTDAGGQSVQMAPTWSPSGKHVLYGSAPLILPRAALGPYSLYVLKNVN